MAEINFQIDSTALQTIRDTDLKANFEETKLALTEVIHPYTQLIVSEDGIASAKSDRARINKIKTNIDSYRKMVKAAYNEPYKRIEEKFKELTAVCDQGINNIDYQVAEYEQKRKQEKLSFLEDYYFNAPKDNPEYMAFKLALHPKWENKTTPIEECTKYIDDVIKKTDTEIRTIRNLHSQWETSLLDEYSRTHDILSALALNERLTEKAQQEAERKRKEQEAYERRQAELERQRAEAKQAVAEAAKNANWDEVPEDLSDLSNPLYGADLNAELQKAIIADQIKPRIITRTFKVVCNENDIEDIKRFMEVNGIYYEELS